MTTRSLRLAKDLILPVDIVTQTVAVLAKRRAGKSYTMRRLVEQLHHAGQQVVLVDPKGDQWGLRSAADGKAPGLPFVILGGERADVPLEAGAGEIVAKLVVEERVSVVLDLSLFRKHEVATFMTAFMENLYRLKAREQYRTPLMLVIDEADAVAPQKPQKGEERMLGAAEDIVRRGGQRGIGCVLVSQRSAVLNKNVLTQAQILIVLRTIAPQDLQAMKAWVDVHGTDEEGAELMGSLPSLPVGDAWVWSPGWPTVDGIFQRVHVLPIETFDSGATPKPGEARKEPKQVADVDLDALKRQMAATIEKAKADDPRELRKQIAELKSENSKLTKSSYGPNSLTKTVEKPVLTDADRALLDKNWNRIFELSNQLNTRTSDLVASVELKLGEIMLALQADLLKEQERTRAEFEKRLEAKGFQKILDKLATVTPAPVDWSPVNKLPPRHVLEKIAAANGGRLLDAPRRPARQVSDGSGGDALKVGERTVLTALAQRQPAGVTRDTLTALTGYKRSTRDLYLQQLARNNWVVDQSGHVFITTEGLRALGSFEPLPVGDELAAYWLAKLPQGESAVLRVLLTERSVVSRDAISEQTGYKRSTRDLYIQQLQRRRIVHAERDGVRASEELFS